MTSQNTSTNPVINAPSVTPESRLAREQGFVEVDGLRLFYSSVGAGMPMFVLPGGPGASHEYLVDSMRALADERRLIFLDPRGCGRSGKASDPSGYTLDAMVEDIEAVRRSLGLRQVDIFGHSFGGVIAQGYAIACPDSVRSLVLACTGSSARRINADLANVKASANPDLRARLEALEAQGIYDANGSQLPEYRRLADKALKSFMHAHESSEVESTVDEYSWDVMRALWGDRSDFELTGSLQGFDFTAALGDLTAPALILYGEHDIVSDETARETSFSIPASTLHKLMGAAHEVRSDQPGEFVRALRRFFSSLSIRPPC